MQNYYAPDEPAETVVHTSAGSTNTYYYRPYSNTLSISISGATPIPWALTSPVELTNATAYRTSGTNSLDLVAVPTGTYTVTSPSMRGYATPTASSTNITGASPLTNTLALTYLPYSNNISVTVCGYPAGNCAWTISGPTDWTNATGYAAGFTNNATISGVPTGTYTFNFPGSIGYITPTNTLTITAASPTDNSLTGTYVLAYPTNIPVGTGIQKFYQRSYFFTNVYLHDSGVPLHTRIADFLLAETDPIFTNWFATTPPVMSNTGDWAGTWHGLGTNAFAPAGAATGTPIYVEVDPIHTNWIATDPAYLAALTNGTLAESTSNAFWTSGRMIGISVRTNFEAVGAAAVVQADLDNHKTNTDVHAIAAITGLQSALDGKATTGDMVQAQANIDDLEGLTNSTVYTNSPDYTQAVAQAAAAYPASNPSNYVDASVTNDLSLRVDGLTNDIAALNAATGALDSAVAELAGQTNQFIQGATDAATATNAIAVHVADLANPHAVTPAQIGAATTGDLALAQADIGDLQSATGALDSAVGSLNSATGSLNSAVSDLNTATGSLNTAVGNLNTATGSLNSAVSDLNTATGTLDSAVNDLNTATNNINARYPVLEGSANVHVSLTATGQVLTVDAGAVEYGITDTTAYRGDWGASVSGQVVNLHTATGALNSAVGALNSATGSLNSAVSTLNTATNALNTRAGNLDSATNALNTRAANLEAATNAIDLVANAALPKSETNALTVTALQITGGSPTNGAVWVATNTAGQGAWRSQIFVEAYRSTGQAYGDGSWATPTFPTISRQSGGIFDGTNWTPGVSGRWIIFTARGTIFGTYTGR
ncbi:MAG: hypothetical protein M0R06_25535, partial [Sphaerochaeta sp.]|nr:hypothetical protein [Sphaerochaeta sp.]